MSTEQLELKLPTRRAVLLDTPAAPTRRVVVSWGDDYLIGIMNKDKQPSRRVALSEASVVKRAGEADPELVIGYTVWECVEPPPCAGFWEVTDHQTGMPPVRVWFEDNEWDTSLTPEAIKAPGIIKHTMTHEEFRKLYAWRGLKAPWPGGYNFAMNSRALV